MGNFQSLATWWICDVCCDRFSFFWLLELRWEFSSYRCWSTFSNRSTSSIDGVVIKQSRSRGQYRLPTFVDFYISVQHALVCITHLHLLYAMRARIGRRQVQSWKLFLCCEFFCEIYVLCLS